EVERLLLVSPLQRAVRARDDREIAYRRGESGRLNRLPADLASVSGANLIILLRVTVESVESVASRVRQRDGLVRVDDPGIDSVGQRHRCGRGETDDFPAL